MPALLAVTVFALHPLQAEPVSYIFSRSTLLCGLCCWAAIAGWARGRYWLAVPGTALALLAKEEAVALPVFFLLLGPRRWLPLGTMLALASATGLRGLVATAQVSGSGAGLGVSTSPVEYAIAQGYVIVRYLRLFVFPVGFNFDPDILPVLAALCWLVIAGLLIFVWRGNPQAGLWFGAALIFLAPTSSVLPIADLAADRRMYLAVPCLAAGAGLLWPGLGRKHIVALGALLAALSFNRALTFSDSEKLWREAVAGSPNKARPRIQLARVVTPEEAIRVLEGLPPDSGVAAERGRALMELGRAAEALREFGVALADAPGDARALVNRGTALAALGQTDAARQDFLRALAAEPCLYPALVNLRQLGVALPSMAGCRFTPEQESRLGLGSIPYSK
jgi:hypothetical protein